MTQKRANLGGEAGALKRLARQLDGTEYSKFPSNIKHRLRLSRLQRWHGLSGSRAMLIADLAFDGCSR